jgi:hypothetical protein
MTCGSRENLIREFSYSIYHSTFLGLTKVIFLRVSRDISVRERNFPAQFWSAQPHQRKAYYSSASSLGQVSNDFTLVLEVP